MTARPRSARTIPPPANPLGYTDEEMLTFMTDEEYRKMCRWMAGQTCTSDDEGRMLIYPHDVWRGLRLIREGVPTYFD